MVHVKECHSNHHDKRLDNLIDYPESNLFWSLVARTPPNLKFAVWDMRELSGIVGYLLYNRRNQLDGKMFNQKRHFLFCQAREEDVTFYTTSSVVLHSSPVLLSTKENSWGAGGGCKRRSRLIDFSVWDSFLDSLCSSYAATI